MKNIRVFYLKRIQFLEMKFPIYLNRRVLVMVVGDLTAQLWRPYGDPTALLSERRTTAFVLCMPKMRAVARRSMRSQCV